MVGRQHMVAVLGGGRGYGALHAIIYRLVWRSVVAGSAFFPSLFFLVGNGGEEMDHYEEC